MLALDIETTNKSHGAAWNMDNTIVYWYAFDTASGKEHEGLSLHSLVELARHHREILAHNAKFECGWLYRGGLPVHEYKFYDTMLLDWIVRGNRRGRRALDYLSDKYLDVKKDPVVDNWMKRGICPSEMPLSMLVSRCKLDVAMCWKLHNILKAKLLDNRQWKLYRMRCALIQPLMEMEYYGMKLDRTRVKQQFLKTNSDYQNLLKRLNDFTGGINLASPVQKSKLIFEDLKFTVPKDYRGEKMITASGNPSTSQEAIRNLVPKTKKQTEFKKLIMTEAKLRTSMTKYLSKFKEVVEDGDGIIHGNLQQGIAATHRLTSSEPNLQNFDRNLRHLFIPQLETFRKTDYSQLEYRCAGILANDDVVRNRVRDRVDIHSLTASIIFGERFSCLEPSSEQRKSLRTAAKAHTFKPLYGGSSGTDDQVKYYRQFLEDHQKIKHWQYGLIGNGKKDKHYDTVLGLRMYWDKFTTKQQMVNYPVQNLAGEIASLGCVLVYNELKSRNMESRLVNYVHDELLIDVAPGEEDATGEIVELMTQSVLDFLDKHFGLPFFLELETETEIKHTW